MEKTHISITRVLLTGLVAAAIAFRDAAAAAVAALGGVQSDDDANKAKVAELQAQLDTANQNLADLQTHLDDESPLEDEPALSAQVDELVNPPVTGTGDGTNGNAPAAGQPGT